MSINERLYTCARLAGPLVDASLSQTNADAFHGLLQLEARNFNTRVAALPDWEEMTVLAAVVALAKDEASDLGTRFAVGQWARRKASYDLDCASWREAENAIGLQWRDRPMSSGQRFLVVDTARLLEIEIPAGMNRGQAADWLDRQGGHPLFRIAEVD